jgi:putative inorganic carbon (HCO3(-)) transporter
MRDLFFIAYLAAFFAIGIRRPFLLVLVYAYIDIVSPQRLSYYLLNSIPVSAIAFGLAVTAWLATDNKRDSRFSMRQFVMLLLFGWCFYTTLHADFPVEAAGKWNWVWKALVFAIFLPLTLRTRLRMEALALVMVLSVSSIIVTGGIKTVFSGGGYGVLNLMINDNAGLYEGSIISTVAIAIIPLIWWLATQGTIFPPDWRVRLYAVALCGACLLIPIGTEARTGLVCAAFLAGLALLHARRRMLYGGLIAIAALISIPFLPASFTGRMNTIGSYQSDESASTRIAVWKWTWDYVKEHPGGGGFNAYMQNSLRYETTKVTGDGGNIALDRQVVVDKSRAYHNSYFEMLGEQGFPGLALWLLLNILCIVRTEYTRRIYKKRIEPELAWAAPLALALQQGHLVYLFGSMFVGIAYQPFVFMLIALQIGLDTYLTRRRHEGGAVPIFAPAQVSATS